MIYTFQQFQLNERSGYPDLIAPYAKLVMTECTKQFEKYSSPKNLDKVFDLKDQHESYFPSFKKKIVIPFYCDIINIFILR